MPDAITLLLLLLDGNYAYDRAMMLCTNLMTYFSLRDALFGSLSRYLALGLQPLRVCLTSNASRLPNTQGCRFVMLVVILGCSVAMTNT